jgi:hypothetical protein
MSLHVRTHFQLPQPQKKGSATIRSTWLDIQRNCKKMTLRRGIEPRSPALDIKDDKRKS